MFFETDESYNFLLFRKMDTKAFPNNSVSELPPTSTLNMVSKKIICEYVWIGGRDELRSKVRVLNFSVSPTSVEDIPLWNYDGSSTDQADGKDSEVVLKPCALFKNPFFSCVSKKILPMGIHNDYIKSVLVMCGNYDTKNNPLKNNHRPQAVKIFNKCLEEQPWFGIEQEYFIMNQKTGKPLGFPEESEPNPQGQYYCSVGTQNAFGRRISENHLMLCLLAGINMSGTNAEVAPGQWEYQVGPCIGINSGDQLWMSRYILERVAEKHGVLICLEPKPLKGDWNGSGCHTNYSTKSMREGTVGKSGLKYIKEAVTSLSKKHNEHMAVYGTGNEERMTGLHETAQFDEFSYGRANRGASIRIGNDVYQNNKGYFEDRRPSSNMNPYLVTAKLFETTVVNQLISNKSVN